VSDIRHYYRNGMLTTEQIRVFESLPGWTWSVHHDAFDKGLHALRDYISEHKHARVPDSYVTADGFTLGRWVEGRRYDYRKGSLAPSRVALLAGLPEWQWEPLESQFEYGLQSLRRYVAAGNSADVPVKRILDDGFQIGQWVGRRRKDYVEGRLSADRIATLEAISGWRWRIPRKPRTATVPPRHAAAILATATSPQGSGTMPSW
jgi:hypothetical protein